MTAGDRQPMSVSRRIATPAEVLSAVLADPARHRSIDGSGMVGKALTTSLISQAGDTFTMRIHNDEMGDYEITNHVIDYQPSHSGPMTWFEGRAKITAWPRPQRSRRWPQRSRRRWRPTASCPLGWSCARMSALDPRPVLLGGRGHVRIIRCSQWRPAHFRAGLR